MHVNHENTCETTLNMYSRINLTITNNTQLKHSIYIYIYLYWYYTSCWLTVAALQSKANLNTIGIVPHNRDGEVGAETDDSFTCAFDSLTRGTTYIPFETAIVVTIPIDPTGLTMDDRSNALIWQKSDDMVLTDTAQLKRLQLRQSKRSRIDQHKNETVPTTEAYLQTREQRRFTE